MPAHFLVSGLIPTALYVLVVLTLVLLHHSMLMEEEEEEDPMEQLPHSREMRPVSSPQIKTFLLHVNEHLHLDFLIWFFPRPRFFRLHMEKPQKHASTHTLDTEAKSRNKLNNQLYSWTLTPTTQHTPENRSSQESGGGTNHPQHPAAKKPQFPTLDHIPNAQMDGKRRGRVGGKVGSVLCQLELPSIPRL